MRDCPRVIMLFAAGFGTRMAPLTDHLPKPLIKVSGKALIDHALALTDKFDTRVVNLHYMAEKLEAHLAGRDVRISWERERILDTGGGLRRALPMFGERSVATLNSDGVWAGPNPMDLLCRAWKPAQMDALLLVMPLKSVLGRHAPGDFYFGPDKRLERGGDWIYVGAQIIKTETVAAVPDDVFSLNRVWNAIAEDRRLFGLEYDGRWCDVGTPDGILAAERMLADV